MRGIVPDFNSLKVNTEEGAILLGKTTYQDRPDVLRIERVRPFQTFPFDEEGDNAFCFACDPKIVADNVTKRRVLMVNYLGMGKDQYYAIVKQTGPFKERF